MIIDSHAHTFPFLGDATGYERKQEFLLLMQKGLSRHHQPMRRMTDNAIVKDVPIWNPNDDSPNGHVDVNFRVGKFGQFVWSVNGIDYQKQYLPPSLQENVSSAEFMVAQMNYVDVDRCVLQNDIYYGKLNDFFGACVRSYPNRFIGTIHVDEDKLHRPESVAELHRCAEQLGLRGLFVGSQIYWLTGRTEPLDSPGTEPFWSTVEDLGLVVYWAVGGQMPAIRRILDRHPNIASVFCGGVSPDYLRPGNKMPDDVKAVIERPNSVTELCYPIGHGGRYEYPYREAQELIRILYEGLGASKLVWGSDMPNVERHCTYAQSLTYVTKYCEFMSAADKALIAGDNLARLFRIS